MTIGSKFTLNNFIAEIGVNHENSMDRARQMVLECANLGVGAVKFQSYTSDKLAASESPAYWDTSKEKTKSQSELFSRYDKFGMDEYVELAGYCREVGIEFMTTPFDVDYVAQVADIVSRFKVASVDLTNHILLEAIAEVGKPVIMSTGASTMEEIEESVDLLTAANVSDLTLLHCVTRYPTAADEAGLSFITALSEKFPSLKIGYSDHTVPEESKTVLLIALALGAQVIEKHYTFDKSLPGNDHYHAFDLKDLKEFSSSLDVMHSCQNYIGVDNQADAIKFARRGLYSVRELRKGASLEASDVIPLRPQMDYLKPNETRAFLGRVLARDIKKGEGLKKDDFE